MNSHVQTIAVLLAFSTATGAVRSAEPGGQAQDVRVPVSGWDVNRPADFPGLGDFIGWAGALDRMPDESLLLAHSAGYWHVSFAMPRLIEEGLRKRWTAQGWPLDHPAPTGGRTMMTRSTDGGATWSRPATLLDLPLDDGPNGLFVCRDGTVLCLINVQASWYGFKRAPPQFRDDINGLNTQQCVLRSTDAGRSWSKPIWIESPGSFYERSHGKPIGLPDGGILWPTYYTNIGDPQLYGAIHRSDDSGKTWRTVSRISRKDKNVDEPAIARLADGRLILVTRPDGGILYSADDGTTWTDSGRTMVSQGRLKAPRLFVLRDGALVCVATYNKLCVFISTDGGRSWTEPIPLDPTCYGYPGGFRLGDDSILISYCQSGQAPNRVYVIRFAVNPERNGITRLPVGRQGDVKK